jgi:3-hydroxyisobutyrate dehydrogenase-like beta-hydroxyacid dehydrogenase
MPTDPNQAAGRPISGKIGMVGLGLLGSAIGARLRQAGFATVGFDLDEGRLREFQEQGGVAVASAHEAAAERLILCLPTSSIARYVLGDVESALARQAIVIDTTTGDPADAETNYARLAKLGIQYLDATVGGSSRQTLAGDAIVMAGGDAAAFERCADVFATFARKTFHTGPAGTGARMKLVLNLALGLNRAVLAEALSFARASGIDPQLALAILQAGPAYSKAMDAKGEKMIREEFTPEARLSQHLKDVRLILESAAANGARVPLSEVHRQLLETAERQGYGAADNCAVIKAFTGE